MEPSVATSRVLRMCVEIVPASASGHHLPFILLMHLVMVMRNLVHSHSEEDTTALSTYLTVKAQGMKKVDAAAHWLPDAMLVSPTALDVRPCIMVCHWPLLFNVIVDLRYWVGLLGVTYPRVSGRTVF